MALKIRLQRQGRKHLHLYRVVITEANAPRDGRFVEHVGNYNPSPRGQERELVLNLDRINYWKKVGAKPTLTVEELIRRAERAQAVQL